MKILAKIFVGFVIIWLIWYITGGPIRATNKYPLVKYKDTHGPIYASSSQR